MKMAWISALAVVLVALCGCSKIQQLAGVPQATPHPALAAKQRAIQMYPALAVKDSAFNQTFVSLYNERQRSAPEFLTTADWPIALAQETAAALRGPVPTLTPKPVAAAPPNWHSPLDETPKLTSVVRGTPWAKYYMSTPLMPRH